MTSWSNWPLNIANNELKKNVCGKIKKLKVENILNMITLCQLWAFNIIIGKREKLQRQNKTKTKKSCVFKNAWLVIFYDFLECALRGITQKEGPKQNIAKCIVYTMNAQI